MNAIDEGLDFLTPSYTKSHWFYNREIELRFDPIRHVYSLVTPQGLEEQDGVSNTCHIVDKSAALIPWACKMMAQKILDGIPHGPNHQFETWLADLQYSEVESMILAAKSAHKEKLDAAANIGHIAHSWIENYIKLDIQGGTFDTPVLPDDPQAASCCKAAMDWMLRHNIVWLSTEQKVYSREHAYAGTMDGLCLVDSCADVMCCRSRFKQRLSLADWKSSNQLYTEYILQTAAYAGAYEEEHEMRIEDRWIIRLGKEDGKFEPWHIEGRTNFILDTDAFLSALALKRALKNIDRRTKEREGEIRSQRKAEKQIAKEASLALECNGHARYKAVRYPKCNGGNPCQACLDKYAATHPVVSQGAA